MSLANMRHCYNNIIQMGEDQLIIKQNIKLIRDTLNELEEQHD